MAGTTHLVWAQNLTGGFDPEVIRHVSTANGGSTWSSPADLQMPPRFSRLRVASNSCGLHVVADDSYGPAPSSILYARWSGGWQPLSRLLSDQHPADADVVTSTDGSIVVAASVQRVVGRDTVIDVAVLSKPR